MTQFKNAFGGSNKTPDGVPTRQVGHSSATPGVNNVVNTSQQHRDNTTATQSLGHPTNVHHHTAPKGNNSKMIRDKKPGR